MRDPYHLLISSLLFISILCYSIGISEILLMFSLFSYDSKLINNEKAKNLHFLMVWVKEKLNYPSFLGLIWIFSSLFLPADFFFPGRNLSLICIFMPSDIYSSSLVGMIHVIYATNKRLLLWKRERNGRKCK